MTKATNREGLTLEEWIRASGFYYASDEQVKENFPWLYSEWKKGVDPAEYRAEGFDHHHPKTTGLPASVRDDEF